jgi:hypothetical protein
MRLLLMLAISCSFALASCGDEEETATTGSGGDGAGHGDWVAEVNRICRQNQADTQQIAEDVQDEVGTGAKATAEIIDRSTESTGELLDQLRDVETPGDVSDDYTAFLDRIEEGMELYPQLADSIRERKEDPELARQFEEIGDDTRPFAQEHGLGDCVPEQG